jgi:hypothetical protein
LEGGVITIDFERNFDDWRKGQKYFVIITILTNFAIELKRNFNVGEKFI